MAPQPAANSWLYNTDIYQVFLLNLLPTWLLKWWLDSPTDRTFGRSIIPPNKDEVALREAGLMDGERWLQSANGTTFYYQTWWDKEAHPKPKGDLIWVHGYADYSGRFAKVCHKFLAAGFRVHVPDLPGHGRSDGIHGLFSSLDELHYCLLEVMTAAQAEYSDFTKPFIMGISLGGLVATKVALENPDRISGLVAFCPCLQVHEKLRPPAFLIAIARVISYIVPNLVSVPRDPDIASNDPAVDLEFMSDPMVYCRGLRAATGFAIDDHLEHFREGLNNLNVPTIILQGEADRMTDPAGAIYLANVAKAKDITINLYPNVEHALLSDPLAPTILGDAVSWLVSHSPPHE